MQDRLFGTVRDDNAIVNTCVILIASLNLFYHLTLPGCRLTVKILKRIITLVFCQARGTDEHSEEVQRLVGSIPADVSTAVKYLDIMPEEVVYACCPECFALYPPTSRKILAHVHEDRVLFPEETQQGTSDALPYYSAEPNTITTETQGIKELSIKYPMFCTHKETSTSGECGAKLLRAGGRNDGEFEVGSEGPPLAKKSGGHFRPIRTFSYQPLMSWIARMMTRLDFEQMIDASHDIPATEAGRNSAEFVTDILQSSEVANFLYRDGRRFLRKHQSECRLIFSLFIDWFGTHGNHRSGAHISSGVIFLACLNLPPEARYKRENIYLLGVLPGPKSPSLQQVNHFLQPIILDLLILWEEGVFLTRTALHRGGRLVRGALITLVADLGAVRKTSGNASHSATFFCSFCQLHKNNINDTGMDKWPRRDCKTFRAHALSWKEAPNERERKRLFKLHGVRYSALLELPYWRPTRFVVLDTMHNMFLGLFQRHCRNIWGMSVKIDGGEEEGEKIPSEDLAKAIQKLQRSSSPQSLRDALNVSTMRALYEIAGLGSPGKKTKLEMASELLSQVSVGRSERSVTHS